MPNTYLFDQVADLKEKFKNFFQHKKKMQALDNYSSCAPFQHKDYLQLIKKCMADGFLGEREADFLCYMIEKYAVNFLDWSHKTKWLKGEMVKLAAHYAKPAEEPKITQLSLFDCQRLNVPNVANAQFEIFSKQIKQTRASA